VTSCTDNTAYQKGLIFVSSLFILMTVSQLMFNSTHHAQLQHCMAYRCSTELSMRVLQV